MKKITILSAAVFSTLAISASADSLNIAVVNYANVFKQVPQGQATLDALKQKFSGQEDALKNEQNKLVTALQDYQRNMSTLSSKDRQSKEAALNKQQQDFQQKVTDLQNAETQAQQAAGAAFQAALVSATAQVATINHDDLILNDQAAPYYNSKLDVSDDVAKVMQKSHS